MWWWLYVVVEAVHGAWGDGHLCAAVQGGILYDFICAQWLWSVMNEHATATINMKGCRGTRAKEEKEEKREREKRKGGKTRKKKCPWKD